MTDGIFSRIAKRAKRESKLYKVRFKALRNHSKRARQRGSVDALFGNPGIRPDNIQHNTKPVIGCIYDEGEAFGIMKLSAVLYEENDLA